MKYPDHGHSLLKPGGIWLLRGIPTRPGPWPRAGCAASTKASLGPSPLGRILVASRIQGTHLLNLLSLMPRVGMRVIITVEWFSEMLELRWVLLNIYSITCRYRTLLVEMQNYRNACRSRQQNQARLPRLCRQEGSQIGQGWLVWNSDFKKSSGKQTQLWIPLLVRVCYHLHLKHMMRIAKSVKKIRTTESYKSQSKNSKGKLVLYFLVTYYITDE